MKDREYEPKSPYVLYATRVKHPPECTVESDKHRGNSESVKVRKGTNLDGSGTYTQGLSTTYLYPTNT